SRSRRYVTVEACIAAAVLALAGCGSGSGGGGGNGGGGGGGNGGGGGGGNGGGGGGNGGGGGGNGGGATLEPTFASIQQNVLSPICTACHVGANAPAGLRLDAANS